MVEKNQVISNFFQNSESNPLIKFFGLYDVTDLEDHRLIVFDLLNLKNRN